MKLSSEMMFRMSLSMMLMMLSMSFSVFIYDGVVGLFFLVWLFRMIVVIFVLILMMLV